ncbi:hypothetical protein ABH904_000496 [Pseudomonas frederiksbergensis]
MRKLCLLAALISPLACAQVVSVETNSLMRLPKTTSTLQLERLEVADYGTLLIPSNVTEVTVGELHLGRDARIAIVPSAQALRLKVNRAELAEGSQITARGAPGTYLKAARSGRNLDLQIKALNAPQLSVDARGGAGAPGFVGLDGANGQAPGYVPGARPVAAPMAVMAATASRAHQGRWFGWKCRVITPLSRSRSRLRAGKVVRQGRVANRERAARPRAASSIKPMVARVVVPVPTVSQGLREWRVR